MEDRTFRFNQIIRYEVQKLQVPLRCNNRKETFLLECICKPKKKKLKTDAQKKDDSFTTYRKAQQKSTELLKYTKREINNFLGAFRERQTL